MKSLILNTATVDNAGTRIVAGAEVKVGDGKTQIAADRAKSLVDRGLASTATGSAKADTKESGSSK